MGSETPTPPKAEINKRAIDMKTNLEKVAPIEGTFINILQPKRPQGPEASVVEDYFMSVKQKD